MLERNEGGSVSHSQVVSGDVYGSLVQARTIGTVTFGMSAVAHSRYRDQVALIAPKTLIGRDHELHDLVMFCAASQVPSPYQWWRADAWAGKSALMATFVLDPPPDTQVVSFFVTARFAGHDTREAFVDHVIEQLAHLLRQPTPSSLTDTNRESHLHGMLAEAATLCRERGQRLILVVDGLDEDRGVTLGTATYSVAGLLPARPPENLRIVVTGRPNPALPSDVSDDHPLRDPQVVRILAAAPAARAAQSSMERELDALLGGTDTDRALLGLILAAQGGLSSPDLAELTGQTARQISKRLNSVAGRSFSRRAPRWGTQAHEVYILAHEGLVTAARAELGDARLDAARQQLREWSERYRQRRWPLDTPEYLLGGYFTLLREAGDFPSMYAFATDNDRHERLFERSGGDTAALAEIAATTDQLLSDEEPDVTAMISLAMHQEHLSDRNARTPSSLPGVFARLGDYDRAEALAEAIPNENRRYDATVNVIRAIFRSGERQRAEAMAFRIADSTGREYVLAVLAYMIGVSGDLDRAGQLVTTIRDPFEQGRAVEGLVHVAGTAGDLDHARAFADTAEGQDRATMALAETYAACGDLDHALALVDARPLDIPPPSPHVRLVRILAGKADWDRARSITDAISEPISHRLAVIELINAAGNVGDLPRATTLARTHRGEDEPGMINAALMQAAAINGDMDLVYRLLEPITEPAMRERALCNVINALSAAGQVGHGEDIVRMLATPEPPSPGPLPPAPKLDFRTPAVHQLVQTIARTDTEDRARRLIESEADLCGWSDSERAEALTALALGLWQRDDSGAARIVADEALQLAQRRTDQERHQTAFAAFAHRAVESGDIYRAETLARSVTTSQAWSGTVLTLARLIAVDGDSQLAEALVNKLRTPIEKVEILTALARRAYADEDLDSLHRFAEYAAGALANAAMPNSTRTATPDLIAVIALAGDVDHARRLIASLPDPDLQHGAIAAAAEALGRRGDIESAQALVSSISDSFRRGTALIALATGIATTGDTATASEIINEIAQPTQRDEGLSSVAQAAAAAGYHSQSDLVVDQISDTRKRAKTLVALARVANEPRKQQLLVKAVYTDTWSQVVAAIDFDGTNELDRIMDSFINLVVPPGAADATRDRT